MIWFLFATIALSVLGLLGMAWCLFMIYRVNHVYEWHMQILNENPDNYLRLPPFDVMVRHFWVWDPYKFLPESKQ